MKGTMEVPRIILSGIPEVTDPGEPSYTSSDVIDFLLGSDGREELTDSEGFVEVATGA